MAQKKGHYISGEHELIRARKPYLIIFLAHKKVTCEHTKCCAHEVEDKVLLQ